MNQIYPTNGNKYFFKKSIYLSFILIQFLSFLSFGQLPVSEIEDDDLYGGRYVKAEIILQEVKAILNSSGTIILPLPSGQVKFVASPNTVLSESFQRAYPNIKTYDLLSEDGQITGKLTINDSYLYAQIQALSGEFNIRPLNGSLDWYESYDVKIEHQLLGVPQRECGNTEETGNGFQAPRRNYFGSRSGPGNDFSQGENIRTYRVVVVTTEEFGNQHGVNAMMVIANTIQGWNVIYNKDLGVNFTLVGTQIYSATNPSSPYLVTTDQTGGDSRTNQAAEAVQGNFMSADYDIGHVFHFYNSSDPPNWSGGGVAFLRAVCRDIDIAGGDGDSFSGPLKAGGWSGSFDNTTNGWLQLSAHEIGHMFGAEHTFNGTGASCTGAIAPSNAYEIASGNTIMSYNGICSTPYNIPSGREADNYFHVASISQMIEHINSQACGATAGTNNVPIVDADPCAAGTITIPKGTPFTLIGSAVDADGDNLIYVWEQVDEDNESGMVGTTTQGATLTLMGENNLTAGDSPFAPLFRSFPPSTTGNVRNFPSTLDGSSTGTEFEVLPQVSRNMTFALTVRDCEGGVACQNRDITVADFGPLLVSTTCGTVTAGNTVDINLTTNGSTCNNAKAYLSTDGGITFPIDLGTISYSNGNQTVTIPTTVPTTDNAIFKVVCEDNSCAQFFQVTNSNCTITNTNCTVVANSICPAAPMSVNIGDAANFTLQVYQSTPVTTRTFNITTADPDMNNIAATDRNQSSCMVQGGTSNFKQFSFIVDQTGNYNFSFNDFRPVHIFSDSFDPNGGCNNFIASSVVQNEGIFNGIPGTVNLTECTTYHLLVVAAGDGSTTVNFSGPGNVYEVLSSPVGTEYTFVAVNTANNQIVAQNTNSDFSSITTAGNYKIYGVNYQNTTPSNWIGQTIATIQSANCVLFSNNCKNLTLTGACAITADGLTNVACTDGGTNTISTDDAITFTLTALGNNVGASYTVSVDGGGTITPTTGDYGTATSFTLGAGSAGGGNVTVTITDVDDATCRRAVVITDPGSCSTNCAITADGLTNVACTDGGTNTISTDDAITFTLTALGNNVGVSYTVSVDGGGTITPTTGDYGTATSFTLGAGSAGGGNVTVTITDVDDATCRRAVVITDPGSCSTNCAITADGLTNVACTDGGTNTISTDDAITFTLTALGNNVGASYTVSVDGGGTIVPTTGNYGTATSFTLGAGSAGGGNVTVTITDVDDATCRRAVVITDPGSCSTNCAITADGLTNVACNDSETELDASDDFISFSLNPTGTNLGAGYSVSVENGSITPVNANYGIETMFQLSAGSAGTGDITITITDDAINTCTREVVITNPGPCSNACLITSAGLDNTTCNTNGTDTDDSDDFISFSLNPTGLNLGANYRVSVDNGIITPDAGTYGTETNFELQAGSAGRGTITVTIVDDTDNSCTLQVDISGLSTCSSFPLFAVDNVGGGTLNANMFMAEDPCVCNGDQVLNANGSVVNAGTFSETITVRGPQGFNIRISDNAGNTGIDATLPLDLAEVQPGIFEATFNHIDRRGYSIVEFEFADPNIDPNNFMTIFEGGTQLMISNVCAYPRIAFTNTFPPSVSSTSTPIVLGANLIGSPPPNFEATADSPSFTVNDVPANIFNPQNAPVRIGANTITGTLDIVAGTGRNGTLANPAVPTDDGSAVNGVCPVQIQQTINVTEVAGNQDVAIPTMSEWGLIIFGLIILNLSVFFIYIHESLFRNE